MADQKLTKEQQRFIIRKLAGYLSYTEVQQKFQEQFGENIQKTLIAYYNPESSSGGKPAEDLVQLFYDLRDNQYEQLEDVPITHPIYRLNKLQKLLERHDSAGADDSDARIILKCIRETREELDRLRKHHDDDDQPLLGGDKEEQEKTLAGALKRFAEEKDRDTHVVEAEIISDDEDDGGREDAEGA